jgi:glutamyl-tRNA synthetase
MEALEWLGIAPSETIGTNEKWTRDNERKDLYQYADTDSSGNAYYALIL